MAGIRHIRSWPASLRTWALFLLMPGHAGHYFGPEPTASELKSKVATAQTRSGVWRCYPSLESNTSEGRQAPEQTGILLISCTFSLLLRPASSRRRVQRVSASVAVEKHIHIHTPSRPASLRAWALSYDQGLATSLQFAVRGDAGTDEILQDPLMYREAVFPGLLLLQVPAGCRDGVAQTGRTMVQLAARIGQQPEAWQCYSARPAATPIADTAGCADSPNDGESLSSP